MQEQYNFFNDNGGFSNEVHNNDGKTFERYFNNFVSLYNLCGGYGINLYYPVDFHLTVADKVYWFELKEMHSDKYYVYSVKYAEKDAHLREQIYFLDNIAETSTMAAFLVWVKHWRKLQLKSPIVKIDGRTLRKCYENKEPKKYVGLNTNAVMPFNFYGMLTLTPGFKRFFANVPTNKHPYLTPYYPDIEAYQDPNYYIHWLKS